MQDCKRVIVCAGLMNARLKLEGQNSAALFNSGCAAPVD